MGLQEQEGAVGRGRAHEGVEGSSREGEGVPGRSSSEQEGAVGGSSR